MFDRSAIGERISAPSHLILRVGVAQPPPAGSQGTAEGRCATKHRTREFGCDRALGQSMRQRVTTAESPLRRKSTYEYISLCKPESENNILRCVADAGGHPQKGGGVTVSMSC